MKRLDKTTSVQRNKGIQFDRSILERDRLLWEIAANYPNSYMSIITKELRVGFTSGQEFKKQNLDPSDFIGLTLEQVFGEHTPLVKRHYLKTFDGEETSFELYFNGQYQLYKTVPLPDENGEINHILAVVENITKHKLAEMALQQSEEKYRTLFETMAQGVVYQDAEGRIISANPAASRILGLSLDQLQGRTSMDPRWKAIHEDGSPFFGDTHPAIVALQTGQPVKNMVMGVYHPSAGEYRWININAVPQFRDDEDAPYQVYTTFEDITEGKRAENALRQREHDLGERVKELNCLYEISALIEKPGVSLSEIIQGTAGLIPLAWQYPEIACARITLDNQVFTTKNFRESNWQQTSEIIVHGEEVGMLEVCYLQEMPERDEGPFLKEERNLLDAIAERLGRVTERIWTKKELLKLASTDPLTGLFNRRHFFGLAGKELERAQRYHHNLSCIMFDIDGFKEANDCYGHLLGDQLLQKVAKDCQEMVREIDILARYGGDEFVILLPETDTTAARLAAERLRIHLEHTTIETDAEPLHLTISVGVAGISMEDAENLKTLLVRADRALYQSKENGRNQVTVWQAT